MAYHPLQLCHLLPFILAAGAIVLTFFSLYAGSSPNFMEDYAVITVIQALSSRVQLLWLTGLQLNTSRIGEGLNSTSTSSSSNPIESLIHAGESTLEQDAGNLFNSVAKAVGLADFYSAHMLDHCQGTYVPGPVPNSTLPLSHIKHNVTSCSNRTAFSHFDPTQELQATLNETHTGVTLQELGWPSQIEQGITALQDAFDASFVLYCIGAGFAVLALLISLFFASPASSFLSRLCVGLLNLFITGVSALALAIASIIMTVVAIKGTHIINHYGKDIGVSGSWSNKFLALTWSATACMVVAFLIGIVLPCCCYGNRRKEYYEERKYSRRSV